MLTGWIPESRPPYPGIRKDILSELLIESALILQRNEFVLLFKIPVQREPSILGNYSLCDVRGTKKIGPRQVENLFLVVQRQEVYIGYVQHPASSPEVSLGVLIIINCKPEGE